MMLIEMLQEVVASMDVFQRKEEQEKTIMLGKDILKQ